MYNLSLHSAIIIIVALSISYRLAKYLLWHISSKVTHNFFQWSNLLTSSAGSIILWMHDDDAMKVLKCMSVSFQWKLKFDKMMSRSYRVALSPSCNFLSSLVVSNLSCTCIHNLMETCLPWSKNYTVKPSRTNATHYWSLKV